MSKNIIAEFKTFTGTGIAQASGVVQLAPDRFIIIDDRKNTFFQALLQNDGLLTASELEYNDTIFFSIEDLEGVTRKPDDSWIYVITSYSGTKKNRRRRLARFQVHDNGNISRIELAKNAEQLKNTIKDCLRERFGSLPKKYEFDIEGFTWEAAGEELLIGFRSPVISGQAVIVRTRGIEKAFSGDKVTFSHKEIRTLDLKRGGIRAISYFPDLGGYLLVSGKGKEAVDDYKGKRKKGYYLWFWDGGELVKEILRFPKTTETPGDEIQPEALCEVTLRDGITRSVLIISDDGDLGNDAQGKYWLLSQEDYAILKNQCTEKNII